MVLKKRKHSAARIDDIPLADYGADENITDNVKIQWVNQEWVRKVLRFTSIASFITVCLNTPKTIRQLSTGWFMLDYVICVVDMITFILFTGEMLAKIHARGLIKSSNAYLKDKWCVFDGIMLVFICISVGIQVCQIEGSCSEYTSLAILRSPRAFIMVRPVRVYLKFQLPKTKIRSIFMRSGQQVWSVTIFLVFFLALYGMLGVQMFGKLTHRCVEQEFVNNEFDFTKNISELIHHLSVPDSPCSTRPDEYGYKCPEGMKCIELKSNNLPRSDIGYNGFLHLGESIFTVYESSSLEGWVFILYKVTDIYPPWRGYFFFITMIFFLAWLVKNVFIAVIIETFAEIRVQLRTMWSAGAVGASGVDSMVLVDEGTYTPWKLTTVDENKPHGTAPYFCQVILQSKAFHIFVLLLVSTDAVIAATYNTVDEEFLYWSQVFFTVLFDLEVLFKIWCLGFRGYKIRSLHKFEMSLAIGTTARIFFKRTMYTSESSLSTILAYSQVLRCVRLIKLFPSLEDFSRKIFGPFVKLGTLIGFTMGSLILVSVISLQLFCCIEGLPQFSDFFESWMAMFQILTQEGWVEVMDNVMTSLPYKISWLVAIYFITYHLFATVSFMSMFQILTQKGWAVVMYEVMFRVDHDWLAAIIAFYFISYHLYATVIVLSMFVAVILDNLELDEDLKGMKQYQASEQKTGQQRLPLRLRVFEKFPDKPQMMKVSRLSSEFTLPKIRDSFIRQFVETGTDMDRLLRRSANREMGGSQNLAIMLPSPTNQLKLLRRRVPNISSQIVSIAQKKMGITSIVRDSAHQRVLSLGFAAVGYRGRMLSEYGHRDRRDNRRSYYRTLRGSLRGHKQLETMKQNEERQVSFNIKVIQERKQQAVQKRTAKEEELRENHPYFDTPLFAIPRESKIRKLCTSIVYARYNATMTDESGMAIKRRYQGFHDFLAMVTYLTWMSILITVFSCISMMWETPFHRIIDSESNHINIQIAEYTFVIFMSLEMLLKVVADGLFFTPKALIRDMGGILDVFIYFVGIVFLFWMLVPSMEPKTVPPGSSAHVFMVLRCFRPLRVCTLVPHIRKLVYELLQGFKEILLVSVLLLALMFIFASYGVQIFAEQLKKCNDPTIQTAGDCVGEFRQNISIIRLHRWTDPDEIRPGFMVPRVWANPRNFDFDNLSNAMLALFEVLSLEGWLEVRDIIKDRRPWLHSIYIHIFVFIGCMIGLTLFVGVVISNYFENKGTSLLTIDQRRWQDLKGRLQLAQPLHLPPKPDHSPLRGRLYDLTLNKYFKRFIAGLVLFNFSLLSWKWSDTKEGQWLAVCSVILNILFVIEVIIKCISLSPIGYWHSRRNRYDLFVTVAGVVWILIHLLNAFFSMACTSNACEVRLHDLEVKWYAVGCTVVLLRFFTITGKHPTLKMLMMTIVVSMIKSFFIVVCLFVFITTYAFMGSVLFGCVKYGENLNRYANFETVPNSISTLFRIVTGEDWNKIMHDCMIELPNCSKMGENYWQTDCGNPTASLLFFGTFYVIIAYIVLNLLVGIIMENFSLFYSNEEDALLSYADIKNFQVTWNMVDVHRKGVIPVSRVKFVLRLLRGRLEVDMEKDHLLYKHMCCEIEKMRNGQDVTFHDVLSMLSYRSVDIRKSLQLDELLAREELEYNIEEEVAKDTIRVWLEKCLKRIRVRERASHRMPGFFLGDPENPSKRLPVPSFIEPVVNITKGDDSQDENEDEKTPPEMNNRELDHIPQTSPSHKLLVPSLSEGSSKQDSEESTSTLRVRKPGRRLQQGSTSSTASGTPSSIASAPIFPKTVNSQVVTSATTDVQDWWKEQLRYDSGEDDE